MKSDKFILSIAVVAAIVALLGAGLTYYSVNQFKSTWLTGYAGTQGYINLSVESVSQINFSDDNVNFGSGRVLSGPNVTLQTSGAPFQTSNGNWTNETTGLTIENIGNSNLSLNFSVGKSAAAFLGGTNPRYEWNISSPEGAGCTNGTGGVTFMILNVYNATSTSQVNFCPIFNYIDTNDSVRIDIKLVIPSDSLTGALSDIVTATAFT